MPAATPDTSPRAARLAEIIEAHRALEGPLLPMLHAIQAEWGHIPAEAIPALAKALNLGRAEVHGVVSFYHDFRHEPAGARVMKVCAAEACQSRGARGLIADLEAALGQRMGETTALLTLEPVYCLGLCANGPNAMLDGRPLAAVTAERLVGELRA